MQVPIYQRGLANLALARSPKRHLAIKVVACDRNRDSLCPRFCPQLRARLQRALFDCRVRVAWARGNFILTEAILEPAKTLKLTVYEFMPAADQTFQLIQKRYWIEAMGSWRRHDNEEWSNNLIGNKSSIWSKPEITRPGWPEIGGNFIGYRA